MGGEEGALKLRRDAAPAAVVLYAHPAVRVSVQGAWKVREGGGGRGKSGGRGRGTAALQGFGVWRRRMLLSVFHGR